MLGGASARGSLHCSVGSFLRNGLRGDRRQTTKLNHFKIMPRQIHYQNPTSCYDFLHTLGTVVAWTATCFAVFAPPALLVMTNGSSRVQFGIQSLACPTLRMADEATLKYNLEQYWCSRDHLDAKEFIGLAGSKLRVLEVIALCAILSSMFASRAASCITFGMLGYLVFLWADQIPDKRSNFDV